MDRDFHPPPFVFDELEILKARLLNQYLLSGF